MCKLAEGGGYCSRSETEGRGSAPNPMQYLVITGFPRFLHNNPSNASKQGKTGTARQ